MMMARGTVVVDENLTQIVPALKEANIHVIQPFSGLSDKQIAENLLVNRIFITRNTKDFLMYGAGLSIGIIGTEGLKFIDFNPDNNETVQVISDAIIKYKIWSRHGGFYLELKDDGNHKFQKFY